jgi:hypothetical protein
MSCIEGSLRLAAALVEHNELQIAAGAQEAAIPRAGRGGGRERRLGTTAPLGISCSLPDKRTSGFARPYLTRETRAGKAPRAEATSMAVRRSAGLRESKTSACAGRA